MYGIGFSVDRLATEKCENRFREMNAWMHSLARYSFHRIGWKYALVLSCLLLLLRLCSLKRLMEGIVLRIQDRPLHLHLLIGISKSMFGQPSKNLAHCKHMKLITAQLRSPWS